MMPEPMFSGSVEEVMKLLKQISDLKEDLQSVAESEADTQRILEARNEALASIAGLVDEVKLAMAEGQVEESIALLEEIRRIVKERVVSDG